MTVVEEAAKDAPAPEPERHCPRCGAALRPEQQWCLTCGAGLGAQIAQPRGWRWPVAVVSALLALLVIALVLALVELAQDSETITPAATPAPTAAPTTAAVPTPTATPNPSLVPPASGGTAATPQTAAWPAGKTGYTVMLDSASSLAAASARAKDLAGQGITAGVLDTSGYKPVTKDRFVIFSGQYVTRADAHTALHGIGSRVTGARVVRIAPA